MAELIFYQLSKDANRLPYGDVIFPAKYVNAYVLAANTAQPVTIPTGARVAMFSATSNFYVKFQGAAAVPTVNVTNGSAPELNPTARDVTGYTTLSLVAPADSVVTICYFS